MPFFLNPLLLFKASSKFSDENTKLAPQDVIEYLTRDNKPVSMEQMKSNYQLIEKKIYSLFGAPPEAQILNKMIFPLNRATGYFVIGNYRESIAVAAFVAEMATIFKFRIYAVSLLKHPVKTAQDELENLNKVELIPQSKRIKKLLDERVIDADLACKLDFVRTKRNKYLHSLTKDDAGIEDVAKTVVESTIDIMRAITGLRMGNGKVIFDPKILEYLAKKDLLGKSG